MDVDSSPLPQRGARFSKAEVRARVLDLAIGIIDREGMRISVSHLRLEDLIREAGVPRSTVYRVWPTREDFYAELIAVAPGRTMPGRLDRDALSSAHTLVHQHDVDLATAKGRRAVLVGAISVAVQANYDNVFASMPWRNFIAVAASLDSHTDPATRDAVEAALRQRQLHFIENMAKYYEHLFEDVGLRLRADPGVDFRQLASALAAYVEGLCLARLVVPELVTGPIRPESPESSTLAIVGFTAVLDAFSEPVPPA